MTFACRPAPHPAYRRTVSLCDPLTPKPLYKMEEDWSGRSTTYGQRRVEAYLRDHSQAGQTVFVTGVGNSLFAQDFADHFAGIDGVTLLPSEKVRADALGIPHYRVRVQNKYQNGLADAFGGAYDYIVDVNLASWACCQTHVAAMMRAYHRMLKSGGSILTDREGLDWLEKGVDPHWRMDFADLQILAGEFGFTAQSRTDWVYALHKS
ncbi:hypothetical protein [Methylovirgula sp. 4M-Z18]|uniref:hypothetical protein n=1 Tax=Methylovirgula sp. 4M-Z18 TaxID=2293567 RepID=UPI000E2F73EC|nr:hypothetical protein [Methylovirgula sp. 4M-Z18]RFB79661.1 hypothetical protein DYH55_09250 [Methylovirgula sp. 4M-Z18]